MLIPIVILMLLFAILRHFITKYLGTSSAAPTAQQASQIRNTQILNRARILQRNCHWIPLRSFLRRKAFFNAPNTGVLHEPQAEVNPMDAMNNPAMSQAMTGNMAMMVPQMLTMGLVNMFFSGFVMVRLPFAVTSQVRTMLQRGVELSHLDVAYVSSLSWYFLNLAGLRGIQSILLAGHESDDAHLMQKQMTGAPAAGPTVAMGPIFKDEREKLEIAQHEYQLDRAGARWMGSA